MGIQVPGGLAVIAFDDCDLFELYPPSITAIYQPIEKIAEATIDLLLSRLDKQRKEDPFKEIVIRTGIHERHSTIRS